MKHTPGPLSIKKAEDSDDPDWAIVDADNRVIGEAFNLVHFDTYRPAEANARLWASAPDLLVALEELLRHLCECCRRLNPQHKDCTWCADTGDARAALGRATKGEKDEMVV